MSADTQLWSTPDGLFDGLHAEFGFTVDAAANRHNAKLKNYWHEKKNGLMQPWEDHVVWCNPPWDDPPPWVRRAMAIGVRAMLLLPVRTDRLWWYECVTSSTPPKITWILGRIAFKPPPMRVKRSSTGREPGVLFSWGLGEQPLYRSVKTGKPVLGDGLEADHHVILNTDKKPAENHPWRTYRRK